jgi:hypothetical protein
MEKHTIKNISHPFLYTNPATLQHTPTFSFSTITITILEKIHPTHNPQKNPDTTIHPTTLSR